MRIRTIQDCKIVVAPCLKHFQLRYLVGNEIALFKIGIGFQHLNLVAFCVCREYASRLFFPLDNYNAQNNGTLISATTVYTCTYGGYSKKLSNIEDLKTVYAETNVSPRVTIANDYSNGLRCLNILKNYGLIDFDAEAYANNITDISACLTKNDYHLNIQAISTALIASSLEDSDCYLGIVNATYALNAGLSSDLLLCEEPEATNIENANIIAIRQEDKDEQWVKDLIECITSDSSKEFIENNFNGVVQPYFDIAI